MLCSLEFSYKICAKTSSFFRDLYKEFIDLKGHRWAYNDEISLSGNLATLAELRKKGFNASFFGHIIHSGTIFSVLLFASSWVTDSPYKHCEVSLCFQEAISTPLNWSWTRQWMLRLSTLTCFRTGWSLTLSIRKSCMSSALGVLSQSNLWFSTPECLVSSSN